LKLAIEIDGTSHDGKEKYEIKREGLLESLGLKLIRYKYLDVLNNFHLVEILKKK
jgi:very-short-patch-repair endonuclease